MANFSKLLLNGSTGGRNISVTITGMLPQSLPLTTGVVVHSGVFGNTSFDECFIYAANLFPTDANLILQWGVGANNVLTSGDCFVTAVPGQGGRVLVADGRILNSGLFIYAIASGISPAASSGITLDGYVNRVQ